MVIFEHNELDGRTVYLPRELVKHLSQVLAHYGEYKDTDGYKRLMHILNPQYNDKSGESIVDNRPHIEYGELRRIKHFFDNYKGKIGDSVYELNGGAQLRSWVEDMLSGMRNGAKADSDKKRTATRVRNNDLKPAYSNRGTEMSLPSIGESKTYYITEAQAKLLKEGAWGSDMMQTDGACDLRGDLCAEMFREITHRLMADDLDNVFDALQNAIYYMEKLGEDFYSEGSVQSACFNAAKDAIFRLKYTEGWTEKWKTPSKVKASLDRFERRLYNAYNAGISDESKKVKVPSPDGVMMVDADENDKPSSGKEE